VTSAFWFAVIAALGNVAGGAAAVRGAKFGIRVIELFVAFGAGFMLSVAFVRMLPEAYELSGGTAALYVLIGYLLVHLTQHTATEHFHFGEETHDVTRMAGVTALFGLLLHTFFDGVAIASGFAVSDSLGVLVFLAILLHKLPEGLTISSLQIAGGMKPHQALGSAALLGLATIVGMLVTDSFLWLRANGLAVSAGVAIYVGASNLVPEFQGKKGWRLPLAFFIGAAAFFVANEVLVSVGIE
jgi:ZIP family zinc transporter/zinc and cadmium transporter